ncbi:MAG: alkaline phosphatase [Paludibacter sp.]|jgi:alkaline phosphatase|nr:alkaline phosphatase [Paludibacter sp.]
MKKLSITILLALLIASAAMAKQPKNVIIMIGDGMGLAQVYTAMVRNGNSLNLERCTFTGFSKTYSANNYTTDSAAGGTAISCGVKTDNYMIGTRPDSSSVENILEQAERNGKSTGLVVACSVTHATPAAFVAHQPNRGMDDEIAADFLKSNIDVFIGGGRKFFEQRSDKRNLTNELKDKGFQIAYTLDEVNAVTDGKLAGLLYEEQNPDITQRGDMLPNAVKAAINILDNNKKGFFMMIEGSQIDWACHANDVELETLEMLDFDKTIGLVLDYAAKDGNTLVIITADHETGGLTLPKGNMEEGTFAANFSTKSHTGTPVPIYAFGPGAENFTGFMENSSIKAKIEKIAKLK